MGELGRREEGEGKRRNGDDFHTTGFLSGGVFLNGFSKACLPTLFFKSFERHTYPLPPSHTHPLSQGPRV